MARYSPLFARTTKREIVVGRIESSKAEGKRTFDGELVSGTWDVQQHTTTSLGVIASAKIRHALLASLVYVHVACYVIRSWSIIIVVRYSLARLRCSQTGNLVYFLFFFSFLFFFVLLIYFFSFVRFLGIFCLKVLVRAAGCRIGARFITRFISHRNCSCRPSPSLRLFRSFIFLNCLIVYATRTLHAIEAGSVRFSHFSSMEKRFETRDRGCSRKCTRAELERTTVRMTCSIDGSSCINRNTKGVCTNYEDIIDRWWTQLQPFLRSLFLFRFVYEIFFSRDPRIDRSITPRNSDCEKWNTTRSCHYDKTTWSGIIYTRSISNR